MALVLYCVACQRLQVVGDEFRRCDYCECGYFTTLAPPRLIPTIMDLTPLDRRFLRGLRIEAT